MLQIFISKKSSLTQKDENVYIECQKRKAVWLDGTSKLSIFDLVIITMKEFTNYCQKQIFLIKA